MKSGLKPPFFPTVRYIFFFKYKTGSSLVESGDADPLFGPHCWPDCTLTVQNNGTQMGIWI